MARKAKCRICGTELNTDTAYKIISYDTNNTPKTAYYCSKEEYEKDEAEKKKAAEDKDKVYRAICEIMGKKEIINTALWKEKLEWNKAFADEVIAQYLSENKDYLTSVISRLEDKEYNRIRYLSAVLKNQLGDFKQKVVEQETNRPKVKVDNAFFEPIPTNNNKRRSLADLEDMF